MCKEEGATTEEQSTVHTAKTAPNNIYIHVYFLSLHHSLKNYDADQSLDIKSIVLFYRLIGEQNVDFMMNISGDD